MPYHVLTTEKDSDITHILLEQRELPRFEAALPAEPTLAGTTIKGRHALPSSLDPFLSQVDRGNVEEVIDVRAGDFANAIRTLFQEGKRYIDAYAESLPPFVSASELIGVNVPNKQGVFRRCSSPDAHRPIAAYNIHHYLMVSLQSGMEKQVRDMNDYPYYFVLAKNCKSYLDMVTSATNPAKIDYDLRLRQQGEFQPLFVHRLAPCVQRILSLVETMRENMKSCTLSEIPKVPFNRNQFSSLVRDAYEEGRAIFDRYRHQHPSRVSIKDTLKPHPRDIRDRPEVSLSDNVSDVLVKDPEAAALYTPDDLEELVLSLLCQGRDTAWCEAEKKDM